VKDNGRAVRICAPLGMPMRPRIAEGVDGVEALIAGQEYQEVGPAPYRTGLR
jgi:hypothetical protein